MNVPTETPQQAARRLSASAIRDGYVPEALHTYTRTDGSAWYYRIRAKCPDGDKWIRPMRSNGAGYELKEPDFPDGKPLYRLHELTARTDESVLVVEGEWCADALAKAGILATTSGAADSAAKADWQPLAGRDVTIWPDNDEPGRRYAQEVTEKLLALNCTVRVIDVQKLGLPPKGDAVDWLAATPGATAADVLTLPCVEPRPANGAAPGGNCESRVILVRGDALRVEPIRWLWDGWLARTKLHVLAGAPGTGKSTIALTLAAVVTAGGRWPDGTKCTPGHVLVWSGEDDPADTLLPRLLAAGADPRRFHIVTGTVDRDGARQFDPATDIPALLAVAREIPECALVLVDPVVAAVLGDSHKNTEVRRALQPLVGFAAELGAAVLGISHFTKGTAGRDPVERVTGSVAFGALPRVVMAAARVHEAETDRPIFCRAKSNIGPDTGGWDYRLDLGEVPGTPGVTVVYARWGEVLEGSARDLLAEADASSVQDGETTAKAEAEDWLRETLKGGDCMDGKRLKEMASDSGIKERTLYRAAQAIGVTMLPGGFGKPRRWHLCAMSAKECHVCLQKIKADMGRDGTHGETNDSHTGGLGGSESPGSSQVEVEV